MDLDLKDRVAMVAAATKGLGLASAETLLDEGARVSLCGRDLSTVSAVVAKLAERHGKDRVLGSAADVARKEDLCRWHEDTIRTFGEPSILVTNTGGPPVARFLSLSEADWQSGIESTLFNVIRLCHLVIPAMQSAGWGRIVHLTSLVAKQPVDELTISSTLRAGLSGLTKTLSNQLAKNGITVNAILTGHVLTGRQEHLAEVRAKDRNTTVDAILAESAAAVPIGRFGTPHEIGDVVAFLCSPRAAFLTGASIPVDGGQIKTTM